MKRKLGYLFTIALVMSLISYGLVRLVNKDDNHSVKADDELVIVTSFYPMYVAALNITDQAEGVTVRNLTENQTGCVHDYQLTTKDMRTLSGADIAILNGGEMEEFMEDVIKNYPDLKVITASEGMSYLEGLGHDHDHDSEAAHDTEAALEDDHDHENEAAHEDEHDHENEAAHEDEHDHENEAAHEEDHDHENETAHEDDHDHTGHNHSNINGHVWMNMDLYMQEIQTITDYLCQYDEEHAELYRKNAADYIAKVQSIKEEFADLYPLAKGEEIIIFHDAFAYLADELRMDVAHTVDTDSESALSAGEIAEVIEEINRHHIKLLFTEEQYSSTIADRIAGETDAKVYVMDSLVTGDANKDAYLTGMRKNLTALRDALAN